MPDTERPIVQIDIISDVVCPWCIVGFRQLEQALGQTGFGARVRWHPFELNPDMAPEGEGLADHMQRKYGATLAQSRENRRRLVDLGASLQIAFKFEDDSRIVNTFKAHKLLDYAASKGLQHPLKLALFNAYFSEGRDVSRDDTLIDVAETVGLKRDAAKAAIGSEEHANAVRAQEDLWSQSGISGVPTMIFAEKYLVTGAQGAEAYARVLQKAATEAA